MSHQQKKLKQQKKLYVIFKNGSKLSIAPYLLGSQPGTHNTLLFEKYCELLQDDDQKTYYYVHLDKNELWQTRAKRYNKSSK